MAHMASIVGNSK